MPPTLPAEKTATSGDIMSVHLELYGALTWMGLSNQENYSREDLSGPRVGSAKIELP